MSNSTNPLALDAEQAAFQQRIQTWDTARVQRFLDLKVREAEMYGGGDFIIASLECELDRRG